MKFAWIISFWFRFLLTVNKYYTIILSNGLIFCGMPHYSALNYKDMPSGRFGNRSHWHVQHMKVHCLLDPKNLLVELFRPCLANIKSLNQLWHKYLSYGGHSLELYSSCFYAELRVLPYLTLSGEFSQEDASEQFKLFLFLWPDSMSSVCVGLIILQNQIKTPDSESVNVLKI